MDDIPAELKIKIIDDTDFHMYLDDMKNYMIVCREWHVIITNLLVGKHITVNGESRCNLNKVFTLFKDVYKLHICNCFSDQSDIKILPLNLRELEIDNTIIYLKYFAYMKLLQKLTIKNYSLWHIYPVEKFADYTFAFHYLMQIQELTIVGCTQNRVNSEKCNFGLLENLKILNLTAVSYEYFEFATIQTLTNLQELNMKRVYGVAGVQLFIHLPKSLRRLTITRGIFKMEWPYASPEPQPISLDKLVINKCITLDKEFIKPLSNRAHEFIYS